MPIMFPGYPQNLKFRRRGVYRKLNGHKYAIPLMLMSLLSSITTPVMSVSMVAMNGSQF